MAKFTLLKQEGRARRGTFETVHGTVQTPVFMNVGTCAAIRGGVSTDDLREIGCQHHCNGRKSRWQVANEIAVKSAKSVAIKQRL